MRIAAAVLSLTALACAKAEQATPDSAAATAGPATLTEADVAGTWTGTMKVEGSDSVVAHWTQVCASGACKGTAVEAPDTVLSTYEIAGDSVVGRTAPFADATTGGVKVVDSWVIKLDGPGRARGRGSYALADNPDSVTMRYTFEGARNP